MQLGSTVSEESWALGLSLAGRKQPLASGFRHVGLLAWKIVPGLYNSEAGDWGVTI